jgi:hypothetical protein
VPTAVVAVPWGRAPLPMPVAIVRAFEVVDGVKLC